MEFSKAQTDYLTAKGGQFADDGEYIFAGIVKMYAEPVKFINGKEKCHEI